MKNRYFLIAAILSLAALMSACATPVVQAASGLNQQNTPTVPTGQTPPTRTVSVTGEAKVELTPDIAYIYIGVHSENADASQAISANNSQAQKVIDALKAQGVAAKDIQTTNFSVYPNQKMGPNGETQGTTYVVDNTVYVTVRDLNKLGDILGAATSAGANNINGIQFDVADKTAALAQARQQAVADAQTQAQQLATAAGATLGPVISISTSTNNTPIPFAMDRAAVPMAAAGASVPVNPGQLTITLDVSVVYGLQ